MSHNWLLLICALPLMQGALAPHRPLPGRHSLSPVEQNQAPELIIPAGTELQLSLQDPLSSKLSEPGDDVIATLRRDVTADGMVLLRRGTEFIGKVTMAVPAKMPFKGGQLHLNFDHARIDGRERRVSIVVESVANFSRDEKIRADSEGTLKGGRDGGRTLRNVGTGAAFGMTGATVILLASAQDRGLTAGGAIASAGIIAGSAITGMLLTSGREIRLDQNSLLRMKLERALRLE